MITLLEQCTGSRLIPTGTRVLLFSSVTTGRGKSQQGCWILSQHMQMLFCQIALSCECALGVCGNYPAGNLLWQGVLAEEQKCTV